MFGLFRTPDVSHPQLGVLTWKNGCWRGEISLPGCGRVPLVLAGSRKGPDAEALSHGMAVPNVFRSIQAQLEQALFEHHESCLEAIRDGHLKPTDGEFHEVKSPADALLEAKLDAVLVVELDGELATELCYKVPWDEEHTLGARFRGTQWIELCGSTRVP